MFLIEAQSAEPRSDFNVGVKAYEQRRYRDAFTVFAALIVREPQNPNLHYYLGLCYKALGHERRAKQQFDWVLDSSADPVLKVEAAKAANNSLVTSAPSLPVTSSSHATATASSTDGQTIAGKGKDARTSYTVYLPRDSKPNHKVSWILALSPSGMGLEWQSVLKDACDKYGWAYVASNNSSNAISWPDSEPLLKDTVASAVAQFPLDANSMCVAGFSGGAMRAHRMSYLWPNVRKIIVNCGTINEEYLTSGNYPSGKAVVFLAGASDFNTPAMKENEKFLSQRGWQTKWIDFLGFHQYAPADAYEKAIDWLRYK